MLDLRAFSHIDFPYMELPDEARKAALTALKDQGFTPLEQYTIFSLNKRNQVKANILAFAHPVHRTPEYTGLTVFNAPDNYSHHHLVPFLATSTAPFHLIHRKNEFSLWSYSGVAQSHIIEDHISYDQLENFLKRNEADISPQRIVHAKQGDDAFTIFQDIEPLQLSLWAAEVTGKRLVEHFAAAAESLRADMNHRSDIREAERDRLITTLSIQLLGAIILGDTGVLGDEIRLSRPSFDVLMRSVCKKFTRYFTYDIFNTYSSEAERAYELLRGIYYTGFMPDMLRDLYKTAYSKKARKESGSFDTPLHLTRRIWKNIPVEYLAPQARIVADMTCGWGSFLVAAHERLSRLKDMEGMSLRSSVFGNDSAVFPSQLAGLGLLLSTSEDSWNIDQYDALIWPWLADHRPTIIVGNPPFEADRRRVDISGQKQRRERANQFLEHAMRRLAPGGYLAMIMPRSFVAAEASHNLRKSFLDTCDVLELWELPTQAFPDVTTQALVVFAHKQEQRSHGMVRVRTIQSHSYEAFRSSKELVVTASGLVADQSAWNDQKRKSKRSQNTHIMDYKTILSEKVWDSIRIQCTDLQEYATCFRGVTCGNPSAEKRQKSLIQPEQVQCLVQAREIVKQSFLIDYARATTITYPDDLQWPRLQYRHVFDGAKVIMIYTQRPGWGRKAKVAIERKGYYISDDFWVLTLDEKSVEKYMTYEVLAAIAGWDVSNAWIIEHMSSPSIRERAIQTIPFPLHLTREDCEEMIQAVLQIEKAAYAHQPEPIEAAKSIDALLKKAYALDDATFARLRQVKEWGNHAPITLDPPSNSAYAQWSLSGIVQSVDTEKETLILSLSGFHNLQEVKIVPSMPGWMLRPGAAFYTKIPRVYIKKNVIDPNTIDWGTFYPQHYTYMTEEELFADLANVLHEDDNHRV